MYGQANALIGYPIDLDGVLRQIWGIVLPVYRKADLFRRAVGGGDGETVDLAVVLTEILRDAVGDCVGVVPVCLQRQAALIAGSRADHRLKR